jgi:hypothetical protein
MFPTEVFRQTVAKLKSILDRHQIRFHLTGGLTGTAYGEPRMTQDVDVVIDPARSQLTINDLVHSLAESDFMYDEESTRTAIGEGGMFQLLDLTESLKLDVYPRELIPGELNRSVSMEIFEGEYLPVVSRVDAAASKLIWVSKGSHKSRRDFRAIFRNADEEGQEQIRGVVEELGLTELFNEVLHESDEIS